MYRRSVFHGVLAVALAALAPPARGEDGAARADDPEVRLDEVVVRVQRPEPAGPGAAATVVDAAKYAGEAKSVAELLATAPGVAVREYGGLGSLATVSIRGASADGVRVLLDGLPLNTVAGGGVNLSSIPRQWIDRIEVVRGAEGARYGAGALGGAVNVVTRRVQPGDWSSQLSYGSFGTLSAGAEGGAGGDRWNGVLALGYDETNGDFRYRFDDRPTLAGNPLEERVRTNNAGRSGGVLAKGFVDVGSGRLDVLTQLSASEHELPGSPYQLTPNDREQELRGAAIVRHAFPLGSGPLRLASEASLRHDRLDTRLAAVGGTALQRGDAAAGQLALAWIAGPHAGEIGVRAGGERLDASGIGARERGELAAFASEEVALAGGRVRVGPAVRWERLGPYQGISAKLGATVAVAGPLSLRGSAGRTFRAPSFAELYLQQGILEPNPLLRSEDGVSADGSLELAGARGLARLGAFTTLYRDLIVYEPGSFGRLKPFNGGKAAVRGLEVEAASRPAGPLAVTGALSYTLLASENLRGDAAVLGNELPHRPRHRVYARVAGARGPAEAHAEGQLVGAQWQDTRNLSRIPEALTFGAGASWRLVDRPEVRVHVDVRNVLDDRTLQDGFGNPLPGRMVLVGLRAGPPLTHEGAPR